MTQQQHIYSDIAKYRQVKHPLIRAYSKQFLSTWCSFRSLIDDLRANKCG